MRRSVQLSLLAFASSVSSCAGSADGSSPAPFEIVAQFPHDTGSYTQGLLLRDSLTLFESAGRYGDSDVRIVEIKSGRILKQTPLSKDRFGEGLERVGDRLYQLTWESHVAYVYDASTLALVDSISYPGEGWGLATDGNVLFMSDGSDSIRVMDPKSFAVQRVFHVRQDGAPLAKLNELEFVNGELLANVYESDWIARIDVASGKVTKLLDFSSLYPKDSRGPYVEVMNGISRAPTPGNFYVTGKLWPTMYEVRLRP